MWQSDLPHKERLIDLGRRGVVEILTLIGNPIFDKGGKGEGVKKKEERGGKQRGQVRKQAVFEGRSTSDP